jgi:triosephosphate isomerase
MSERKPFAVANWKMAMTIAESRRFVRDFVPEVGSAAWAVDVVLCPPYTALHPLAEALADTPIDLGAQNLSAAAGQAHTGEISAHLLTDVGCRWVLLGHWEIRRRIGERDVAVNRKALAALDAGLHPILLIGEGTDQRDEAATVLHQRLPLIFNGIDADDVANTVVVYEPEWTIGADQPASPDRVAAGCRAIRRWIAQAYDDAIAESLRTIYGGSVTPDHARALLASPHVDGLGAGRKGRDPRALAKIVRLIAQSVGS